MVGKAAGDGPPPALAGQNQGSTSLVAVKMGVAAQPAVLAECELCVAGPVALSEASWCTGLD